MNEEGESIWWYCHCDPCIVVSTFSWISRLLDHTMYYITIYLSSYANNETILIYLIALTATMERPGISRHELSVVTFRAVDVLKYIACDIHLYSSRTAAHVRPSSHSASPSSGQSFPTVPPYTAHGVATFAVFASHLEVLGRPI